jgi:hypothetical protein
MAVAAAALVLGAVLYRRCAGWERELRLATACLPAALLALALSYFGNALEQLYGDWSPARLSWSAALLHGYRPYYGPTSGPILSTLYGPVSTLVFVPAFLARGITASIVSASLINALCMALPLLLLTCRGHWTCARERTIGLAGFAFGAGAMLASGATFTMAAAIHADAPAVGLGLLSCLMLTGRAETLAARSLWAAACLAILAVWAKQIEAPLLLAQLTYLALVFGGRTAWRYLLRLSILGGALSLGFVALFGFHDMVFNMFTLPGHQPWHTSPSQLGVITLNLLLRSRLFLFVIAWVLLSTPGLTRQWLRDRDWMLLILAAAFLFPVSVLARSKIGALENSYHCLYYLLAACSVLLTKSVRTDSVPRYRWVAFLLACLLSVSVSLQLQTGLRGLRHLGRLSDNPQQQAFEFARTHRGEAYFPWNPLSTLLAEGKLYHFDYAVRDRMLAGHQVSDRHFRSQLPPNLRFVLFQKKRQDEYVLRHLPEFRRRVTLSEMPGWIVYTRGKAEPGAPAKARTKPTP